MGDADLADVRGLIDAGDLQRAIRRLRRRLTAEITDLAALAMLVEVHLQLPPHGKPKWPSRMRAAIDEIRSTGDLSEVSGVMIGWFLLWRGEIGVCRAIGRWAQRRYPDSRGGAVYRASLTQVIGEQAAALDILKRLVQSLPDDEELKVMLARRLVAAGAYAEAGPLIEGVAGHEERLDLCLLLAKVRCRVGPADTVWALARRALKLGASERQLASLARDLAAAGQRKAAAALVAKLRDRLSRDKGLAELWLELDPRSAGGPEGLTAAECGGDVSLLQALADARIRLGRFQAAEEIAAILPRRELAAAVIRAKLLRARGEAEAADALEAEVIDNAVRRASVPIYREPQVRLAGVIGAHGLGDFVYQLLALATIKRQFRNAHLTLIYNHELSYKDDVLRFCPDLDQALDYGPGALNIPVTTKDWDEFKFSMIFPQPALSPLLLARFARTATFQAPPAEAEALEAQLAARGLDRSRWFVVLHYRHSQSFGVLAGQLRDTDGSVFHDIARSICAAGGQVVRLGHAGMDPLPDVPGYVDLAGAPVALQLYATSRARFMLGCDSGPSSYATAFKTPLLKTNTFSEDGAFYASDMVLPKNLVTWRGEVLSLGGALANRMVFFKNLPLESGALKVVDNTEAQLQHAVALMLERTSDCLGWRSGPPPEDGPAPDALGWPGFSHGRPAQLLDLSHLMGLPVRKAAG